MASKCLKEAKMNRRKFARGKYFVPFVHETSDITGDDVDRYPVKARFLTVPIFALFADTLNAEDFFSMGGRSLRSSDRHPIRSLLQYSNILALDSNRDYRQAITKVDDDEHDTKMFVHVPEFWALTVNMGELVLSRIEPRN